MVNTSKHKKRRIFIVGDSFSNALYHPMDSTLKSILETIFTPIGSVSFSTGIKAFMHLDTTAFDMCISYIDRWNAELSQEEVDNILQYIKNGNVFLILHNGLSYQKNESFSQLVGAKFITHPDRRNLFFAVDQQKSKVQSINEFVLNEEPYQFEMVNDTKNVFLWYDLEGEKYPAGWTKKFGKGVLIYVMPGHDSKVFANKEYQFFLRELTSAWI